MEKKSILSVGAAQAAGTITLTINRGDISKTQGSVEWLLNQPFTAKFSEAKGSLGTFRVAKLQIGNESVIVAAENFSFDEEYQDWKPEIGIHHLPVYPKHTGWNKFDISASLTPQARKIVEDLATEVRAEFSRWIEDDGNYEEVNFNTKIVD